jgi:soluble cytochrome b562
LRTDKLGRAVKVNTTIAITCLMIGTSVLWGVAFAHAREKHEPADAQMKKLHAIMPMFSMALAQMETALESGSIADVEAQGSKILAAIPDLKKSKPHKNIKQRKRFVELATVLDKSIVSTVALAKKGDIASAKAAFKQIEKTCAECHANYRD